MHIFKTTKLIKTNNFSNISIDKILKNLKNENYLIKKEKNCIHFEKRKYLEGLGWTNYKELINLSNQGTIKFKKNEIKCEIPLYKQLFSIFIFISIMFVFISLISKQILIVTAGVFLVFGVLLYSIIKYKSQIVARKILKLIIR